MHLAEDYLIRGGGCNQVEHSTTWDTHGMVKWILKERVGSQALSIRKDYH